MNPSGNGLTLPLLLSAVCLTWRPAVGGNILIVPLEGSHWVNMDIIIKSLHSLGHSVDVLRTNHSWYIKDSPHYKTITVPVTEAFNQDFINPILKKVISIERGDSSVLSFLSLQVEMFTAMHDMHRIICKMAANMFKDEDLMNSFKARKYDLVISDPAWGAGTMLAHALKLPLAYNVRWTTSGEGHLAIAPSPLSYIPMTGSGLTDRMTFIQRVKNFIFFLIWQIQDTFLISPQYQAVCDQFFGPEIKYSHLLQGADLWLMRVDFVFEFPRPTMPNVVYMGGFQCKPAKPLPQHLEDFVQSSAEHGVIIMSLGTLIGNLPHDLADEIAAAFAKLPQKVIWRYKGDRPATLGNNTLLVDWMPQNDLLGHPKVKLFVSHGGTNGIYEALYHGVPIVGIPFVFDQADNLSRLRAKGVAKVLDVSELDREIFQEAIQEVLTEPSYSMNMQRLSRLHRDTPIKPLDNALFWIDFVMRHKGAAHLRTESYRMPWYSYHSVDVILFLIIIALFVFLFFAGLIWFFFILCFKRKEKMTKKD